MKRILLLLILFCIKTHQSYSNGGCAFNYQIDSINNLSVSFIYLGWPGPQTYSWDFGDASGTSVLQNPSYVYSSPGNYTVVLNSVDTNGIHCTSSLAVVVGGSVNCSFISTGAGLAPSVVYFTNTSVGSAVSYQWDFGDGSTSIIANPAHTYSSAGTFSVCLITTDSLSLTCTYCQSITIIAPCDAAFQYTSIGLNTYFVENSLNRNLPVMNYHWDFGDGGTSTLRYPVHLFAGAGNYNVCLTINDTATCYDVVCNLVNVDTILPAVCNANFLFTQAQLYSINIVNTSYGTGLSYNWDFGDGSGSTLAYPSHTYASIGSYNICLSITDSAGCSSNFCDSLNVDSLGNISARIASGFTVNVISPFDLTLTVSQLENINISVNPNPAREFLVVNVKDVRDECKYMLHSITGSVCRTGQLYLGMNNVDLLQLSNGMYFLEVINEKGVGKCWKVVKE